MMELEDKVGLKPAAEKRVGANPTPDTKRKYKLWNDNQLIDAFNKANSISEILRLLGLKPAGGNFRTIEAAICRLNLDRAKLKGQCWSKGLRKGVYKRSFSWRRFLIEKYGHQCSICKRKTWLNTPIPLEADHIDGDPFNNTKDNIRLLCCNCHAQTTTYRNNKR